MAGAGRLSPPISRPAARPLSLHHLTALDVSPPDLVTLAAALGCDHVCLFTQVEPEVRSLFPCVEDEAMVEAVATRLRQTGLTVCDLEYFPVRPGLEMDAYRPALDRGARLGAGRATAHIHDPDRDRALGAFAALCRVASDCGLAVGLEFTHFSRVNSLAEALAFVADAGEPNGDVVLDALHYFRSGERATDLAEMDLSRVGYVQVCDGPAAIAEADRIAEAVGERGVPGEGVFDLATFVANLPPGPAVAVEIPQARRMAAGVPPLERARLAVEATRGLLSAGR